MIFTLIKYLHQKYIDLREFIMKFIHDPFIKNNFYRSIDDIFKISRKTSPISIFLSLIFKFKEQNCIIYKIPLFAIFRYIYERVIRECQKK